jgi:hypothetical protein
MPHEDAETLKAGLLATDLLAPFREHPGHLEVEVVGEGCFDLRVRRFDGLDVGPLNNRAFGTLREIDGAALDGGYVTSGGPDGITVRYTYRLTAAPSPRP